MPSPGTHLDRFRAIARGLDARFQIPGLPIRFGWDALLGLIPGVGDVTGSLIGSYGLFVAHRLEAPAVVLLRMLGNIALDTLIGAIPIVGDLFDVGWKGNLRNLALLEGWVEQPGVVRRRSAWLIFAVAGAVLGTMAAAIWLTFSLLARFLG